MKTLRNVLLSLVLVAPGCTLGSAHTGLIFGGEDLVRVVGLSRDPLPGFPFFLIGTILGPPLGLISGFQADMKMIFGDRGLDYTQYDEERALHPFSTFSRLEEK